MEFDVRDGRAMVSLGPLSSRRFCTYACAFCYVHADFTQYPNRSNAEIIAYLRSRRSEYDIVYVSGDTDSFSPPRTIRGLELLEALEELGCDVLFTTRAALTDSDIERIARLNQIFVRTRRLLIACISISRLRSAPYLEPKPVPDPTQRIDVLRRLKRSHVTSVLAMRPFLPVIPPVEYVELASLCKPHVDVVLGESWYADQAGVLEAQVLKDTAVDPLVYVQREMDFDANGMVWNVWEGANIQDQVTQYCRSVGLPFYMRSRPAILFLRSRLDPP